MTAEDPPLDIRQDDLRGPEIRHLLRGHLDSAIANSPAGAAHALDLDALRHPSVTVWSAWFGEQIAGCGALRALSDTHGELKSMRTAASHVRKGVATALLLHMMGVAQERGYRRLSLETGKTDEFAAARALYTQHAFLPCPPFGDYVDDGFSICMTRLL